MRRLVAAVSPLILLAVYGLPPASAAATPPRPQARPVLEAVTVRAAPASYRARPGDTLSSIARREYGHASRWPALWWVNRAAVPDPDRLRAGQRLTLSGWHPARGWLTRRALAAIPAPPAPRPAAHVAAAPSPPRPAAPAAPAPAPAAVSYAGSSSFEQCVIARESGGDPAAVNSSSGAGGLFGFLPSTWASLGFPGLPENASVATQDAAFAKEYALAGTQPWAPEDGC